MRDLAASVVERGVFDADSGDSEALRWLLNSSPPGEEYVAGGGIYLSSVAFPKMDKGAAREALCKKYKT